MSNFLLTSLVASVVLTVLLNLVPRLFPNATKQAEQRMVDALEEQRRAATDDTDPRRGSGSSQSRVKVFFPWKLMLGLSVGLTVVVNLVNWLG